MTDDEIRLTYRGSLPLTGETFWRGLPCTKDHQELNMSSDHDKVNAELVKMADLRRRLDALETPALIKKLELEGRIATDADRADVRKLVVALGIEDATRFTARWPVKAPTSTSAATTSDERNAIANKAYEQLRALAEKRVDVKMTTGVYPSRHVAFDSAMEDVRNENPELTQTALGDWRWS